MSQSDSGQASSNTMGAPMPARECRHDSTRRDGTLNDCCHRCGLDGYWHDGHRHDEGHPSGKILFRLACPEPAAESREEPS